jgi:GNAT superfamily N-acetyltransferase
MRTDAVLIRPVQRGDRTGWLRLWGEYHAHGPDAATELPGLITDATWDRFFQEHDPTEALVAELEARLVGFAHVVFHGSTSSPGQVCFLHDLFVEETMRGTGIGRALVEAVYARAKTAGARRVYWHVRETNAEALRLYDKVASHSGHVVYRKDL